MRKYSENMRKYSIITSIHSIKTCTSPSRDAESQSRGIRTKTTRVLDRRQLIFSLSWKPQRLYFRRQTAAVFILSAHMFGINYGDKCEQCICGQREITKAIDTNMYIYIYALYLRVRTCKDIVQAWRMWVSCFECVLFCSIIVLHVGACERKCTSNAW